MLPDSVFKMPFCIKMSSNICVIKEPFHTFMLKFVLLFCPGGGDLGLFHIQFFALGAVVLQRF